MSHKEIYCPDNCKELENENCNKYNVKLENNVIYKFKCFMCRNNYERSSKTGKNS